MICRVCNKRFTFGNNPITGAPNGFGLQFDETGDKLFNVCSTCLVYRQSRVIEMTEAFKEGIID